MQLKKNIILLTIMIFIFSPEISLAQQRMNAPSANSRPIKKKKTTKKTTKKTKKKSSIRAPKASRDKPNTWSAREEIYNKQEQYRGVYEDVLEKNSEHMQYGYVPLSDLGIATISRGMTPGEKEIFMDNQRFAQRMDNLLEKKKFRISWSDIFIYLASPFENNGIGDDGWSDEPDSGEAVFKLHYKPNKKFLQESLRIVDERLKTMHRNRDLYYQMDEDAYPSMIQFSERIKDAIILLMNLQY